MKKLLFVLILSILVSGVVFGRSAFFALVTGYDNEEETIVRLCEQVRQQAAKVPSIRSVFIDHLFYKFVDKFPEIEKIVYFHYVGETEGVRVDAVYGGEESLQEMYHQLQVAGTDFIFVEREVYGKTALLIIFKTREQIRNVLEYPEINHRIMEYFTKKEDERDGNSESDSEDDSDEPVTQEVENE